MQPSQLTLRAAPATPPINLYHNNGAVSRRVTQQTRQMSVSLLFTIELYYFAEIAKGGSELYNLSKSAIPDSPATVTPPQERECTPHRQRFRGFQRRAASGERGCHTKVRRIRSILQFVIMRAECCQR